MNQRTPIFILLCIACAIGTGYAQNPDGRTKIVEPSIQHVYLKAGSTIHLQCIQYDGQGVEWFKDTEKLESNPQIGRTILNQVVQLDGKGVLASNFTKFNASTADSSDKYICQPTGQPENRYKVEVTVAAVTGQDATLVNETTITLGCEVDGLAGDNPLYWYHKGNAIVPEAGRYILHSKNNTLEIQQASSEDSGEYQCVIQLNNGQNFTETVLFNSAPHVKHFAKSRNLVQGDPVLLECVAYGYPTPVITWLKDDVPMNSTDSRIIYSSTGGLTNNTLRIENLEPEDRALYTCLATNELGSSSSTMLVRVKDKYAALWPFLGIVAEVTLLCIIIFIYEKRRMKNKEEEAALDGGNNIANSHDHKEKDEIRQRK